LSNAQAERVLRERRREITEALGLEFMSTALVKLDPDEALAKLSGEYAWAIFVQYLSPRFVIFDIMNDAVIFSFDAAPLEDVGDLRKRLDEERLK
jgi:hypothetical protein